MRTCGADLWLGLWLRPCGLRHAAGASSVRGLPAAAVGKGGGARSRGAEKAGRRSEAGMAALSVRRRGGGRELVHGPASRSEEHTSELQSLMRISYAVFCLKKKKTYI